MEFSFDVDSLFPDTITKVTGGRYVRERGVTNQEWLSEVVEKMGQASARAQGLRMPITTMQKLRMNEEILYILKGATESGKGAVVGMIKVGKRKLFLADRAGIQHEVEPVSVLDFYVHESKQRSGYGKQLFEAMMQGEGVKPHEVPIDRPSSKFLAFLKKHYRLQSYIQQANHFVVFDEFFNTCQGARHNTRRACQGSRLPSTSSWTHAKIPVLKSGSKVSSRVTPLQSTTSSSTSDPTTTTTPAPPPHLRAASNLSGNVVPSPHPLSVPQDPAPASMAASAEADSRHFSWTVNSISSYSQNRNFHHQDRMTYKLRNLQGTGSLRPEDNTSTGRNHKSGVNAGFLPGNSAPFLNMRSRQRSLAGVFPSVPTGLGSSLSTSHQRSYGFAHSSGYSRHGAVVGGAGGVSGNRVGLKGDDLAGKQPSTQSHDKVQTKDSWRQFIT